MDFLRNILKPKERMPPVCPNSEYLGGGYWCDLGQERVRITNLAFTYPDIKPDHVEKVCQGNYTKCPLYQASRFSR